MLKVRSRCLIIAGVPRQTGYLAAYCLFTVLSVISATSAHLNTSQLINASIVSTEADWKALPRFTYVEQDIDVKDGMSSSKSYQVCMIDGTPYSRLIAVDSQPISPDQRAREDEKLRQEIAKRSQEASEERAKRVQEYEKGRARMFDLLHEMATAFNFQEVGQERMDGHEVYVLKATPRPGYKPANSETKILTGMRGTLWIDKATYQWVRVEAVAIKPVWMGWFIAKVLPGTEFALRQEPVTKSLWLPKQFSVKVKARILLWHKNYVRSENYSQYEQTPGLPQ